MSQKQHINRKIPNPHHTHTSFHNHFDVIARAIERLILAFHVCVTMNEWIVFFLSLHFNDDNRHIDVYGWCQRKTSSQIVVTIHSNNAFTVVFPIQTADYLMYFHYISFIALKRLAFTREKKERFSFVL